MPSLDELDARIRAALQTGSRVVYALAYGSRTQTLNGARLADEFSDLEYYAYTDYTNTDEAFDPRAFLETVTPLLLYVVNDFGTPNAVTPELHRIELHVAPVSGLTELLSWPNAHADPVAMLVKDPDGRLARLLDIWAAGPAWTPGEAQEGYDRLLNWLVFADAVARRGEHLRAAELLVWVRGGLLRLAALSLGAPLFPAPTRLAERYLDPWAKRISSIQVLPDDLPETLELARDLAAALKLDPRPTLLATLQNR
jgi:lincosamide nucleotidyltransferase B/F